MYFEKLLVSSGMRITSRLGTADRLVFLERPGGHSRVSREATSFGYGLSVLPYSDYTPVRLVRYSDAYSLGTQIYLFLFFFLQTTTENCFFQFFNSSIIFVNAVFDSHTFFLKMQFFFFPFSATSIEDRVFNF